MYNTDVVLKEDILKIDMFIELWIHNSFIDL